MFPDLSYPTRGNGTKQIIIGAVLLFVPILATASGGYLVRVIELTLRGERDPPTFDDWETLFIDGLVVALITFVYGVVPMLVLLGAFYMLVAGGILAADAAGSGTLALIVFLLALALLFVVFLVSTILQYFIPAAIASYAGERRIGAAFDFGTVKAIALNKEYLMAIVSAVGIIMGVQIVAGILAVTIIGILFIPFLIFYAQVLTARAVGLGIINAADADSI